MMNLWQSFNNKKTNIGASLMLSSMVLQKTFEIWSGGLSPDWANLVIEALQWGGGLFTGVGLGHKGIKNMK